MKLSIFAAMLALSCDLPTKADVRQTVNDCRTIVDDGAAQIDRALKQVTPLIVTQCVVAAEQVCSLANISLEELAITILTGLGCARMPDGQWDCSDGVYCHPQYQTSP